MGRLHILSEMDYQLTLVRTFGGGEEIMEYTLEQLKHKTVVELREIAKGIEHEAVQGYTQLNKEHLLVAISKALGIQHEHHEVVGVDKAAIKSRIRELKK